MFYMFMEGRDERAEIVWSMLGLVARHPFTRSRIFECSLQDEQNRLVGKAQTEPHAPGSEPLFLVVARAIEKALARPMYPCLLPPSDHCTLCIRRGQDDYVQISARLEEPHRVILRNRAYAISRAPSSAWELARWMICESFTGALDLPSLPSPVKLPVYDLGEVRYCRLSDFPEGAAGVYADLDTQTSFERIDGLPPDAVCPRDAQAFLGIDGIRTHE